MRFLPTLIFFVLLCFQTALAQEPAPTPEATPEAAPEIVVEAPTESTERELRVAVAGSPPFVVTVGKDLEGLSVETWRALAGELGANYKLTHLDSIEELLQGVQDGSYDVGVGPISITSERATFLAFTQPYYDSSLGILSHNEVKEREAHLEADFKKFFLGGLLLLLILALVGSIFWLLERNQNEEQFDQSPAAGIGSGMWMALVTMTTVGYGDKAPTTLGGRVATGVWMLVTTVTLSSLTAWLATSFTLSKLEDNTISDASQLKGRRVAVVTGTTSEVFARHFTSQLINYDDYVQALESLEKGVVDAVVYDYPVLYYHMRNNPDSPLRLAESTFALQDYGFVMARDNPQLHRFNVGLLRLSESGLLRDIRQHWARSANDIVSP